METESSFPFEELDFIYMPSENVVSDVSYFTEILGGRIIFAIESMGTKVAMIDLTGGPPRILLTDHLEDDRPILIYRVADLKKELDKLESRGWEREETIEIPHGPCCSFKAPGGQRLALYQLTRPDVPAHFEGRRDF
ncbi:MAG: VOC family protein [Actinomycetota bacterium]